MCQIMAVKEGLSWNKTDREKQFMKTKILLIKTILLHIGFLRIAGREGGEIQYTRGRHVVNSVI